MSSHLTMHPPCQHMAVSTGGGSSPIGTEAWRRMVDSDHTPAPPVTRFASLSRQLLDRFYGMAFNNANIWMCCRALEVSLVSDH